MKLILILALGSVWAVAQTAPTPRLLTRPGDVDALPESLRQKMVEAEEKAETARERFHIWKRAQPNPGYESIVEIRWMEFLKARSEAINHIIAVAQETPRLEMFRQKIVLSWTRRMMKSVPRIPKRSGLPEFIQSGASARFFIENFCRERPLSDGQRNNRLCQKQEL